MQIEHVRFITFLLSLFGLALSQVSKPPLSVNTLPPRVVEKYVINTPLLQSAKSRKKWENVSERVKLAGGCGSNLCFAIDSSAAIPSNGYRLQLNFANLIAGIVGQDPTSKLAGAQYSRERQVISRLTTDTKRFLRSVNQSTADVFKSSATFMEPSISFCSFQLAKQAGEPAVLILFADRRSNFVDLTSATRAARAYVKENPAANEILAIGGGFEDNSFMAEIVGSADRVILVGEWESTFNVLEAVVTQLCDLKPSPPTSPAPPGRDSCPCKCFAAKDPGPRAKRKVLQKARKRCSKFKGRCTVTRCAKTSPVAFQCC